MTCRAQASPPPDFADRHEYVWRPVIDRPTAAPLWVHVGTLLLSIVVSVAIIWALMLLAGGGT